jgi:hypothetical protein
VSLVGSLSFFIVLFLAPELAVTPYFVGVIVLGIVGGVLLTWAGVPMLTVGRRTRSIVMRDVLDLRWWSGPPPRR